MSCSVGSPSSSSSTPLHLILHHCDSQLARDLTEPYYALDHQPGCRHVDQNCPAVREIVRAGFQRAGADIVLTHLHVAKLGRRQEARIEVGTPHPPLRTDLLGQPAGDGPMSSPDFQTAPAGLNS